jgi:type VI secretion system ImpC/EvpB family protein
MARGTPFVIGVVGSFSGTRPAAAHDERSARARFREVDRDGLDPFFRAVAPRVDLNLAFGRSVALTRFEDLHPDALVYRFPALETLLAARDAVGNPAAMRDLLERAGVEISIAPEAAAAVERERDGALAGDASQLLDSMLGGEPAAPARRRAPSGAPAFDAMVAEIVANTGDSTDYARQDRWRAAIDTELSLRLRAVLHHPAFCAMEAAWRSLHALVMDSETGDALRICALDFARADLDRELEAESKLEGTTLYRLVVDPGEGSFGGDRFDLLVTDFSFEPSPEDARALLYLQELAERTRVPILAAAHGGAVRIEDASEEALARWNELRRVPGARWLGLCAPRLLLRAPYGAGTDPIESFPFDEAGRGARAETYLWGSSAFALARAVAHAVAAAGTPDAAERFVQITGLPIHVHRAEGEVRQTGPVELPLTEKRIEAYRLMGLIPVTGIRGQDAARILSLRSMAGTSLFAS